MGTLNLKEKKEIIEFISGMLERRGLNLYKKALEDWEIHGPHPDMNYQVYIGLAKDKKTKEQGWVAIYPKSVYWIEDPSDWWKVGSENKIFKIRREE